MKKLVPLFVLIIYVFVFYSFAGVGVASAQTYTLTTTTSPSLGGGTSRNPTGSNTSACMAPPGGSCQSTYTTGTVVTMTAIPSFGYNFGGWNRPPGSSQTSPLPPCYGSTNMNCIVTMDASKSVFATFGRMYGTLTASPNPCIISAGSSSCNTTLTWATYYPDRDPATWALLDTSAVTSSYPAPNTIIATGNSGSQSVSIPYLSSPRTFYLYNNAKSIVPQATSPNGEGMTVSAVCASGSVWDGGICVANQPPVLGNATINPKPITANGSAQYTIVLTGTDSDGGGDIASQYALINHQCADGSSYGASPTCPNAGSYRGYVGWSNNGFYYWGGNYASPGPVSCTNGGFSAEYGDATYGNAYINIVDCSTSVSGSTRTTTLTVTFNSNFTAPTTSNIVSAFILDAKNASAGWTPFVEAFDLTPATQPDLTVLPLDVSPTTATAGVAQNYTATIANIGTASASGTITHLFQYDDDTDHSSGVTTATTTTTSTLAAGGGTALVSNSHTFTVGTRHVRVCADNNTSFVGTVTESNEGNNCGNWTAVVVSNPSYTITGTAGGGGTINPSSQSVSSGNIATLTVTPSPGYSASASGCGGSLVGTTYTTAPIVANCTVTATFTLIGCPAGSVSLTDNASASIGDSVTASAPAGFSGGTFVSSKSVVATVSGSTVTAVTPGWSVISGTGWNHTNGATNCSLSGINFTSAKEPGFSDN